MPGFGRLVSGLWKATRRKVRLATPHLGNKAATKKAEEVFAINLKKWGVDRRLSAEILNDIKTAPLKPKEKNQILNLVIKNKTPGQTLSKEEKALLDKLPGMAQYRLNKALNQQLKNQGLKQGLNVASKKINGLSPKTILLGGAVAFGSTAVAGGGGDMLLSWVPGDWGKTANISAVNSNEANMASNEELKARIAELDAKLQQGASAQANAQIDVAGVVAAAGLTGEAATNMSALLERINNNEFLDSASLDAAVETLITEKAFTREDWDATRAAAMAQQPSINVADAVEAAGLPDDLAATVTEILQQSLNGKLAEADAQRKIKALIDGKKLTDEQWIAIRDNIASQLEAIATAQQPEADAPVGSKPTVSEPSDLDEQPQTTVADTTDTAAPSQQQAAAPGGKPKPTGSRPDDAEEPAPTTGQTKLAKIAQALTDETLSPEDALTELVALVDNKELTEAEFNDFLSDSGITYKAAKASLTQQAKPVLSQQASASLASVISDEPVETTWNENDTVATQDTSRDEDATIPLESSHTPKPSAMLSRLDNSTIGQTFAQYAQDSTQLNHALQTMGTVFQQASDQGALQLLDNGEDDGQMMSFASVGDKNTGVFAVETKFEPGGQQMPPLSIVTLATAKKSASGKYQLGQAQMSYATIGGQVQALPPSYQPRAKTSDDLASQNTAMFEARFGQAVKVAEQMKQTMGQQLTLNPATMAMPQLGAGLNAQG
jgi:hypothetical protein